MTIDETLQRLALFVDYAQDTTDFEGLQKALQQLRALKLETMSPEQRALVHFYSANALGGMREFQTETSSWCDQPLLDQEVLNLRLALSDLEKVDVPSSLRCRILTNLGNAFSRMGRFIEALACWNKALSQDEAFGMALANRGLGYFDFARYVQTAPEQSLLLRDSRESLYSALKAGVEVHAAKGIKARYDHISSMEDWAEFVVPEMPLPPDMPAIEAEYRNWCRSSGLLLSPLNDLINTDGLENIKDSLLLPDILVLAEERTAEPPVVYGMFNQAKQEFISARYLAFEAITERRQAALHFSDRSVALLDMLDFRLYRLWVERLKMSFLAAHAIFDKLAYLMNDYWKLGLAPREVSFDGVWYVGGRRRGGISPKLEQLDNWPLKGLFWLSRDFYQSTNSSVGVTPEARMLHEIRNHIAHKYLRVHDELIAHQPSTRLEQPRDFSFQVTGNELEDYTLLLLRIVRSAMMYLAAAVVHEEDRRSQDFGERLLAPMVIFPLDDDFRF